MSLQEVRVPDIGEYSNVSIIEIMVKPGQTIAKEASLLTLETDKATMEIPAPFAGVVKEVLVKLGDKVSKGSLILKIESEAASAAPKKEVPKNETAKTAPVDAGNVKEIIVPDIGEYSNVTIIEVMMKPGQSIAKEASLITLETDKATMEIPAPFAGSIDQVLVKVGDKVSKGSKIATVQTAGSNPSSAAAQHLLPQGEKGVSASFTSPLVGEVEKPQVSRERGDSIAHATPAIRRFARELGVELSVVSASGRKGRITEEDVKKFVKGVMQSGAAATVALGAGLDLLPDPVVDFAKFGDIETKPLSRIKKISGANLSRNWVRIPHVTFFEDADITDLEDFRGTKKAEAEKVGVKLTPVPFIVKAVAKALKAFPNVNSSLQGDNQVFKKYINVGVAVDTPNGLMVPVIKNADQKGIYEIAKELAGFAAKAKDGKLTSADMQGGCFTISSLGGIGTQYFTPIVNMPEVAILGISKAQTKPVYEQGAFVPRLMLPLSLSVDHRVIDGAEAGKFVVTVAKYLGELRELLL